MDVLRLLENKNRCLHRFLELSRVFQISADRGDFSKLTAFETRRVAILKAVDLYDRKISDAISLLTPELRTRNLIEKVKINLDAKDEILRSILGVDELILAKIEAEKTRLKNELSGHDRNRDRLKKFKSGWMPEAGEELDTKL